MGNENPHSINDVFVKSPDMGNIYSETLLLSWEWGSEYKSMVQGFYLRCR
jgi:hypothetical protein